MSKDFSDAIKNAVSVSTSKRGGQREATPAEAKLRRAKLQTQGKKGAKAKRINLAFSDVNYDFVSTMASMTGKTMTHFVNYILDEYRESHKDLYLKAQELRTAAGIFREDLPEGGENNPVARAKSKGGE